MTKEPEFTEAGLVAALKPLRQYLDHIVICGGWTLFIYRHWYLKGGDGDPVRTPDVDLAVGSKLPVLSKRIDELLKEAGFKEEYHGTESPPVTHFVLNDAPYLEFITPHKGGGELATRNVQKGLPAQELKFLEIVLENYREIDVPKLGRKIRVVTPAAYLFQKGLTFVKRAKPDKKAKDLVYLFELLHEWPALRDDALNELPKLMAKYHRNRALDFIANLERYFPSISGEGVNLIARQQPKFLREHVRKDPTNGPGIFRQAVFDVFQKVIDVAKRAVPPKKRSHRQ